VLLETFGVSGLDQLKVTDSMDSMDPRARQRPRAPGYIYLAVRRISFPTAGEKSLDFI
jgi:hypothetical protein